MTDVIEAFNALKDGKRVFHDDDEAVLFWGNKMCWMDEDIPVIVRDQYISGWRIEEK